MRAAFCALCHRFVVLRGRWRYAFDVDAKATHKTPDNPECSGDEQKTEHGEVSDETVERKAPIVGEPSATRSALDFDMIVIF